MGNWELVWPTLVRQNNVAWNIHKIEFEFLRSDLTKRVYVIPCKKLGFTMLQLFSLAK
jgi:hypothetical protein